MLCLTLRVTQYLRHFKVNFPAFSTLTFRKKADKSRKLNLRVKNLKKHHDARHRFVLAFGCFPLYFDENIDRTKYI